MTTHVTTHIKTRVNYKGLPDGSDVPKHIEALRVLFPGWLRELIVEYVATPDSESYASAAPQWEYRRATIALYPIFFGEDEADRRHILRHELIHVLMGGLLQLIQAEHIAREDGENSREWERHMEAATEDIAWAVRALQP